MPAVRSALRSRTRLFVIVLALTPVTALAQPLGIGRPANPGEIADWNIDIRPDGTGLPPGSGGVAQGEQVFQQSCAACHGAHGEGSAMAPRLVGGIGSLATAHPVRTVGSYWPYATTLFDYVRRAMPFNAPESLASDQVYAVCAYILYLNGIAGADAVLDARALPQIVMPNQGGFHPVYQPIESHP
jgi:S-disulfanyl-L-cysteine oxidoreductase SoxD